MLSKDVSRKIESMFGRQKIGHTGTLDPMAEGVLPILLGRATRLQDLLVGIRKSYVFDIALGYETDTLDLEGKVVKRQPIPSVTRDEIQLVARSFEGRIEQVPPLFSAVKYKGRPLHEYVRSGRESQVPIESLKRDINVEELTVEGFSQEVIRLRVRCSKGTYVRCLARDIAHALGTCATVIRLIRTESSGFDLDDTIPLEELENGIEHLPSRIIPIEKVPLSIPHWRDLTDTVAQRLWHGKVVSLDVSSFESGLNQQGVISMNYDNLLLVNKECKALGIGKSRREVSGRVRLSLKRGLL